MIFNSLKKKTVTQEASFKCQLTAQGIQVSPSGEGEPLEAPLVSAFLAQLVDDGYAIDTKNAIEIPWDSFFEVVDLSTYAGLAEILHLPSFTSARPVLQSRGALTDVDFSIALAGWYDDGRHQANLITEGAVLVNSRGRELMRADHWFLLREITAFARRDPSDHHGHTHRQAWGRIRSLALKAQAKLDDFLQRSIVVTPARLDIHLRKSEPIAEDSVIEIEPSFEGAPSNWLAYFDQAAGVPDRYDIVTPEGITQILITPDVKTVLGEIKRLPLRRVAGSRAQAFILNPYAALGEAAKRVIEEKQFEQARESAGLKYERFSARVEYDALGYPAKVGLLVESMTATEAISAETLWLTDEELVQFVEKLRVSLLKGFQLLGWKGYDFELQGDTPGQLALLEGVVAERIRPASLVSYADVHDLSSYSARIEGIGVEKPYYSPYIAKKTEGEGWFPENILPLIAYTPDGQDEPVTIAATKELLGQLQEAVQRADVAGEQVVQLRGLPQPMPVREAKNLLQTFAHVLENAKQAKFTPPPGTKPPALAKVLRKTLVLRPNIEDLDYLEQRRAALQTAPGIPEMPARLCPDYSLLPHQRQGLAWLQHLYRLQKMHEVRGAVLADDMGLGKTFQLLAFMAWIVEKNPATAPMLVVAPVSLLENWREEAGKFLQDGALPMLVAYGDALASLRVPREAIESRLRNEDGLVKFLKPGWVEGAKVVLTTYETLRDLEFSFAAEKWSVMVCDEAQRIKNPAAMVTRAAKKQNVAFKIACTGTPVENTLADLWCLFDYIQPGLLGALNDFGKRYRKPIEARTEEERTRVEELRSRIAPQILRRTKAEVVNDLPPKIVVESCRRLPLSTVQRGLYAKAIEDFKKRHDPQAASPFKNHLGLLQYLRLICTDPRRHGLANFRPEPVAEYRAKAPKLDWLLNELKAIEAKSEKAIVFCEFRNIQRLLQHYIEEVFRIKPDIINGDTSAATLQHDSRQKRIKQFQSRPGFGVIILSPVAVGFGVNIQAANHVIHYTRTWNPAKEDQATDRAYRIGQNKPVYVYYPVVHADDFLTFDVKLDQLLTIKRELAGDMLNGAGDLQPGDFEITAVVPGGAGAFSDERIDLELALRMEWRHFEGLAAALWSKQGFDVCYCTPGSNDYGVDAVAISGDTGVLIQTKTAGNDGAKLGWETVKEVVAGAAFYERRHPGVRFKKVGITNQFFNANAYQQAELNDVELIDQTRLTDLLGRYPVTMMELEQLLYTDWASANESAQ